MNFIIDLLNNYGYLVLLTSLILELIAFPLPGEALMAYCGYVVYLHKMNWYISILVASLGAIIGITISYFIGRSVGIDFFEKHGHYVHLDKKMINRVSNWFQSYGSKLLIAAYFIPGIRHVTGYFSGITRVSYIRFAINAYLGAFLWSFSFITLGKVLGEKWNSYHSIVTKDLVFICLLIAMILVTFYVYRNYKQRIQKWMISSIKNSTNIVHSLRKIEVLIAGIATIILVLFIVVIGMIQLESKIIHIIQSTKLILE